METTDGKIEKAREKDEDKNIPEMTKENEAEHSTNQEDCQHEEEKEEKEEEKEEEEEEPPPPPIDDMLLESIMLLRAAHKCKDEEEVAEVFASTLPVFHEILRRAVNTGGELFLQYGGMNTLHSVLQAKKGSVLHNYLLRECPTDESPFEHIIELSYKVYLSFSRKQADDFFQAHMERNFDMAQCILSWTYFYDPIVNINPEDSLVDNSSAVKIQGSERQKSGKGRDHVGNVDSGSDCESGNGAQRYQGMNFIFVYRFLKALTLDSNLFCKLLEEKHFPRYAAAKLRVISFRARLVTPLIDVVVHMLNNYFDCHQAFVDVGIVEVMKEHVNHNASCITVLNNFAYNEKNREMLRDTNAIESLLPLAKAGHPEAACAVANVFGQDDDPRVAVNEKLVKTLLLIVKSTVDKTVISGTRFIRRHMLMSLSNLAASEANKALLCRHGALNVIRQAALSPVGEDPHKQETDSFIAKCIWNLAFSDEVREKINADQELVNWLKTLQLRSLNETARKNAAGALFTLDQASNQVEGFSSFEQMDSPCEYDVMISYSWSQQERALKVRRLLASLGLKVWIDVECMEGSTLQAMASAVENSRIILVCVSRAYKESPNTRLEAEYAFQKRKMLVPLMLEQKYQADGWLGALIGAKLWYDFHSDEKLQENHQSFLKRINTLLAESKQSQKQSSTEDKVDSDQQKLSVSSAVSSASSSSFLATPVPSASVVDQVSNQKKTLVSTISCPVPVSVSSASSSAHSQQAMPAAPACVIGDEKSLSSWTVSDVEAWVTNNSTTAQFAPLFVQHNMVGKSLLGLHLLGWDQYVKLVSSALGIRDLGTQLALFTDLHMLATKHRCV